jgi:cation diffusion facilitator CzcD-associated flavoprotein CzcO
MTDPLDVLAARARHELNLFSYPPRDWVLPRGDALDVAIIGGGQSGLAIAFALHQARIRNIRVFDQGEAGHEGPWVTFARMVTLRTVKELPGPAMKQPALAYRSWFEAQHGQAAWNALVRIPKGEWMRYLNWLRDTLKLPVQNETKLVGIAPEGELLRLTVRRAGGEETLLARKVVLATGLLGAGGPNIPAVMAQIPRQRWAHSSEPVDFAALAGRRVVVQGGGASAWDNAATALEAGAASVELHIRRPEMPQVNSLRWMEFEGLFRHFAELDDLSRWRIMARVFSLPMPPPVDTMARCEPFSNFRRRLGAPWLGLRDTPHGVRITLPDAEVEADFIILGTGATTDPAARPELAAVLPHIQRWADVFSPPPGEEMPAIALHPYLTPGFALREKTAGACPALRNIHLYNNAALPSMGPVCGGINGMPQGVERLADAIARDFMQEDAARYVDDFLNYEAPDPVELEAAARRAQSAKEAIA